MSDVRGLFDGGSIISYLELCGDEVCGSTSICSSERPSAAARLVKYTLGDSIQCCCGCWISGNGISMLTSAVLFASIATVQYLFANSVGSSALQADYISMAVDALSFLGNLFAYCYPEDSRRKRRVELGTCCSASQSSLSSAL